MKNCAAGERYDSNLLLVLRGEIFRRGDQHTRDTFGDQTEQLLALSKLKEHVVEHLQKLKWHVTVVADVVVSDSSRAKVFTTAYRKYGFRHIRISNHTFPTQVQSWAASFLYAIKYMSSSFAVLIVRADMLFKVDFPLPPPHVLCGPPSYLALWLHKYGKGKDKNTVHGNPRICDVSFFIPNSLKDNFLHALYSNSGEGALHKFLDWTAPVETIYFSKHGTNPARKWNPLYFFVGRPRKMTSEPPRLTGPALEMLIETKRTLGGTRSNTSAFTIQRIARGLDEEPTLEVNVFLPNLEPPLMPHLSNLSVQVTKVELYVVVQQKEVIVDLSFPLDICSERVAIIWRKAERVLSIMAPITGGAAKTSLARRHASIGRERVSKLGMKN